MDEPAPVGHAGRTKGAMLSLSETTGVLVVASVFLAILMGGMDGLVVSTVLPTIAADLHQVDGVTFVVSGYLVASTIAIPIFGRLSDISSRRNVMLAGLAIFIAGSALAGLSQNLGELIVFRSIQGFGGGGIFPVAIAMVAVLFPPETRAKVVSILTAAGGIAIVAGPLVGSYIVGITTWRWVFYINLPFGFFAMAILWRAVGPLRAPSPGRFDAVGAGLLTGWVAAVMIALVQVSDAGWAWTNPWVVSLLAAAVLLCGLFVVWEVQAKHALVPLRLLRERVMASASGIMLFTGIVFSAMVTFLSLFVGLVLGGSAGDVRDAIYFLAIPMILGAALVGPLLDRFAYRTVVVPGLLGSGLAALLLGGVTAATGLWHLSFGILPTGGLVLPLVPVGFGLGIALAGATVAVQNEAPSAEVGAAVALTRFFQSLGGALGISLLTIYRSDRFADLVAGATTPAQVLNALATSFANVFTALAVCILLAFVSAIWLRGRVRPTGTTEPTPPTVVASRPGVDP